MGTSNYLYLWFPSSCPVIISTYTKGPIGNVTFIILLPKEVFSFKQASRRKHSDLGNSWF